MKQNIALAVILYIVLPLWASLAALWALPGLMCLFASIKADGGWRKSMEADGMGIGFAIFACLFSSACGPFSYLMLDEVGKKVLAQNLGFQSLEFRNPIVIVPLEAETKKELPSSKEKLQLKAAKTTKRKRKVTKSDLDKLDQRLAELSLDQKLVG